MGWEGWSLFSQRVGVVYRWVVVFGFGCWCWCWHFAGMFGKGVLLVMKHLSISVVECYPIEFQSHFPFPISTSHQALASGSSSGSGSTISRAAT